MLYRPPESGTFPNVRDLVIVFGLVALGILTTAGAVWAIWQAGRARSLVRTFTPCGEVRSLGRPSPPGLS
jgi:hypothetical protein